MRKTSYCLCGLILLDHALLAETGDTLRTLSPVEVTALSSAATAQTLDAVALQRLATASVADALKYFAGVQIKDYGGLGGLKTVDVRSLGAAHTALFVDGVPHQSAQTGTPDLGKFSLSTMQSVTVSNTPRAARCPTASAYASAASLYLDTRRPVRRALQAQLHGASFDTYSAQLTADYVSHGWSGMVDVAGLTSRGSYPFSYHTATEDTTGYRRHAAIRYLRSEATLFKKGFAAHVYYYQSVRGCPSAVVRRLSSTYDTASETTEGNFFAQTSYTTNRKAHHWKGVLRYAQQRLHYTNDINEHVSVLTTDNHYREETLYGDLSYQYQWPSGTSLLAASDVHYTRFSSDMKYFHTVHRIDWKSVVEGRIVRGGWHATASLLSLYYHDATAVQAGAASPIHRLTPALSLAYLAGEWTYKAWYKRTFRMPTLNDLYYTQGGNRQLQPETATQYDAGLTHQHRTAQWQHLTQADLYFHRVTDRLVYLPLHGTTNWSMVNYGKTLAYGLTLSHRTTFSPPACTLSLFATLTAARDLNRSDPADAATYNHTLCYAPALSYSLSLSAERKGLSLSLAHLYTSKRKQTYADPSDYLPAYHTLDVKASYRVRCAPRPVVSLEVFNLTDHRYELIARYPMPGRNFKLSCSFII